MLFTKQRIKFTHKNLKIKLVKEKFSNQKSSTKYHDGAKEGLVSPVSDEDLLLRVDVRWTVQQVRVHIGQCVNQSWMTLERHVKKWSYVENFEEIQITCKKRTETRKKFQN